MTARREMIHAMHRAGLRIDDSATAADVAIRAMRERRDCLIRTARACGFSYRQIARIFGIDHARVIRVVTSAPT